MRAAAILTAAGALLLAGCATRVEPIHETGDPPPVSAVTAPSSDLGPVDEAPPEDGTPTASGGGLDGESAPKYRDGTPMPLSERTPTRPSDQNRANELLGGVAKIRGVEEAMRLLGVWREADPIARANCHGAAHLVGRWAARGAQDDLGEIKRLLTLEQGWCEGGYMHGVTQQYALGATEEQLRGATPGFCEPVASRDGRDEVDCYHGLGHGFALRWPASASTAFEACKRLEEEAHRSRCYGGVAMEFRNNYMGQSGLEQFRMTNTMGFDKPVRVTLTKAEKENLCGAIDADAQIGYECYMELVWIWVATAEDANPDFVDLERLCRRLPEPGQLPCARGAGYFAVDLRVNLNEMPDQRVEAARGILARSCSRMSEAFEEACVTGYVYRLFSGFRIELDNGFCGSFTGVVRQGCDAGLEQARQVFDAF